MRMDGQRVVVFGGTGSFGYATAKAAAGIGADVVIVSPSADKVKAAAESLGPKASGLVADVNDDASIERMFADLGAFDHLAMTVGGPVKARGLAPVDDAKTVFETRFWGQYRVARAAGEKISKSGSITLVSGATSQRPMFGALMGSMVNAAIESMMRVLATQFAPVRVNAVAPGVVDSNQMANIPDEARQALYDTVAATTPAGRVGTCEDISEAYLFLMRNSYISGSAIYVDGGALLTATP
ncbi:SDR family oxidoreductase [Novosphingobium beihaiensis]|uniref:SDR family oxidoreductase n=1 Tax=Novosphingobium beihaiensis TaxID=2930389 RepID=A0ABT0BRE5_9SPHN|nr:SDR family oxidoreductase [Novosphingobium beihaiensis]MCJ2187630.1 SDR family oxidoreductase [Novosphingobium beihaiensis]